MSEPKYIVAYPPVDFSRPFTDLNPQEVDIYFHYDSTIGAKTCKAACAHCYFRNQPTFHVPVDKALAISQSLRAQGYNIGMASADSFADEALAAGDAGSAFRLKTIGTLAWSSGTPLFLDGWRERLTRAWTIGFRSVIITAHESAGTTVPIRGVTKAPVIRQALKNIATWNRENTPNRFTRAVTFTIRRDNCDLKLMHKMVAWGVAEGIDLVRFNCFANFQRLPEHVRFEMSRDDIIRFYSYLATLQQEFAEAPTALGISEDWGDAGVEQIYPYLPPIWQSRTAGWCRAGYRLFAMIEVKGQIVLTGCVDKWEPILGRLVEDGSEYRIEWDYAGIDAIRRAVLNQDVYACWGGVGCKRPTSAGFSMTDPIVEEAIFKK